MSSGIVLASATSPTEQAVFDELVHRGVEQEEISSPVLPMDDSMVHAWPVPEADHVDPASINKGDFVLFYRGSNRYTWAAQIHRIDPSRELTEQLMSQVAERTSTDTESSQEFSETILWLDIPVPIELESYRLHDLLNLDQEALTRTIIPQPEAVQKVHDEYGSVEEMLQTTREDPSVFIELTSIEDKPYKQPGEKFALGTAVFSRSESKSGDKIYETLREPEVGDLVLHILKDTRELQGVSTVTSTLQTDFEGPPDDSWEPEARGQGYFLPLGQFREFDDPIDIDEDLLQNEDYRERLQTVYDDHDGLVYDKNFELAQGAYFTECPLDLLYICLAELPELLDDAKRHYWSIDQPPAVDQYDSVTEAVVDVRTRLPFADRDRSWFLNIFAESIIEAFTTSLSSVQPNAELTETEATHCKLIERVYTDREEKFSRVAERLTIGRTNHIGPAETLFFVLFRELQASSGVSPNMSRVKIRTILNENYEIEAPTQTLSFDDEMGPLEAKDRPERGEEIARQLTDIGQMVFYGPPGTGKTYTAKQFAHWWINDQDDVDPHNGQLETVTFHPSFTYEDFIEGLSVDTNADGTVVYDEEPGVFLEFAERARQEYYATDDDDTPPRYVLIIDEINRGNLAQIFGEMITALEADKRLDGSNQTTVSLAHSGDRFLIPPNLFLIGTMNTADRSIALVDAAIRRRFRFLGFPPNLRLLREEYGLGSWADVLTNADTPGAEDHLLCKSLIAIHELNARIRSEPDLGRGKQIGHSFLFEIDSDEEIVDTWRFEILPLLEEYLFGQYDRIRESLFTGDGEELFDWDRQEIRSFNAETLSTALETFVESFDLASVNDSD
jgi:5-methylcytosine-specific restriction protein B